MATVHLDSPSRRIQSALDQRCAVRKHVVVRGAVLGRAVRRLAVLRIRLTFSLRIARGLPVASGFAHSRQADAQLLRALGRAGGDDIGRCHVDHRSGKRRSCP